VDVREATRGRGAPDRSLSIGPNGEGEKRLFKEDPILSLKKREEREKSLNLLLRGPVPTGKLKEITFSWRT